MRKALMMTVVTALLLATGACGTKEQTASTLNQAAPEPPAADAALQTGCQWDHGITERVPMGINQLANVSAAAITGQITAITPPRWNSRDGKKWCPPLDGDAQPMLYRDVTVKVTDLTFSSDRLTPRPGDELVIRTLGDGTTTGKEIYRFGRDRKDPVLTEGQTDGRFEVDKEVFLFLSVWDFPTESGFETVNAITGSWGGNFEVDRSNDVAKSVEPGRTVPYRALIARAQKERELGRKPERDAASRKNPLAE
jgi:hypothetical protein